MFKFSLYFILYSYVTITFEANGLDALVVLLHVLILVGDSTRILVQARTLYKNSYMRLFSIFIKITIVITSTVSLLST